MKLPLHLIASAACLAFGACASQTKQPAPAKGTVTVQCKHKNTDTPFSSHPSSAVRGAASFGGGLIGGFVGIPVSIALVPVTYPLSFATKDKWTGLYPFGAFYYVGGAIFGACVAPFVPSTYTRAAQ